MDFSGFRYHCDHHKRQRGPEERCRPRRKKHNHYIAVFESPQLQSIKFFYPQDSTWREFRCPTVKSRGATAVFCDYVVYIIGGCKAYHMPRFNVFEKQWQSKSAPPTNRDFPAACVSEGMIYTSGGVVGKSALDVFECYDTRTESWQVKPSMMTARCDHGSVAASGLIYVCGGTVSNDVSSRVLNNFEVFDPSTQNWTRLRGMKGARKNHGLVVVNKRIYAVGGQGASGVLDSVEYYDIASNQWHGASPIPWRFVSLKCVAVKDMIYVLAGRGFERALPLKYVLEYHTRTDRWVTCRKADAFPNPTCLLCVIAVPSEDTGLD